MNIEEVRKKLLEHGYTLISKEYKSNKDIIEFSKDGYFYVCSYNGLTRTYNPKKWSIGNKYSIQNMNLFLERNDYICRIISKEYNYNHLEFKCGCGESYFASFGNVLANKNISCKKCAIDKRSSLCIKPEKEMVFNKYNLALLEEYTNGTDYLYFIDNNGYKAKSSADSLVNYNGNYIIFTIKNKYLLDNVNRYIEINSLRCKLLSTKISDTKEEKITFKCNCGEDFSMSLNTFLSTNKDICNKCSLTITTENAKIRAKEKLPMVFEEFGIVPIEEIKNNKDSFYYKDSEGYYLKISLQSLQHNVPFDSTKFHICNKYTIENIKTYIKNNKLSCEILETEYLGKNHKMKFICKCGNIFEKRMYDFMEKDKCHCKECGKASVKSKIEVLTKQWLEENGIKNIGEKTFEDCKDKYSLPFDFYLPTQKICIECQGIQHYKPIEYFGGNSSFEYTINHDKLKREYCKANGIQYLEMSYILFKDESYKQVLKNSIL